MHSLIHRFADLAEAPEPDGHSLASQLRDSYDPEWGTYNGALVDRLMALIGAVVKKTPSEEVRAAFNLLAEANGVDPMEKGEQPAGPYSDMFVESVLDAIQEKGP
jgi:hypothetical protein